LTLTSGSSFRDIAVIGLGTGALACYAEAGQRITFLEIDPLVERIARDPRLFTYLQNSTGTVGVAIGDGRKLLERTAPESYDLIIADAFSSDSVPVHLLTREALQLYVSRLRSGGVLALHISNRYLGLEPVVAATVAAAGLHALANNDDAVPRLAENVGRSPSHWVVVSAAAEALAVVRRREAWRELRSDPRASAWTDDYSNVFQALRLRGARR
jgi:spermidine synthase